MTNLLKNPGFEEEWTRDTFLGVEFAEIFTPKGWVTWWSQQKEVPHDPENKVGYGKPETKVIPNKPPFTDPPRVRSGKQGYLLFTFWRIHDAGLYQRVAGIKPNTRLKASAWGHAWSNQNDDAHISIDDENIALYVGIDPTGATDPFSDSIVWSKPQNIYDKFGQVSVQAVSTGDAVTVFLRSTVLWPYKHCDVYWDDAALEAVSEGTEFDELSVSIQITPTAPKAGETASVSVTVNKALSDARLSITDPTGAPSPVSPPQTTVVENKHQLVYRFVLAKAGTYQVRFTDSEGTLLAQQAIKVAPEESVVQGRGQPREQYERVYILLPLGASSEWIRAIVDSGRWDKERWTIGASADDAGIGDLDKRIVLAINPSSWSDDLEAFFKKYYPGVVYKPLPAASPLALRDLLKGVRF
jgi:hypothetical protein